MKAIHSLLTIVITTIVAVEAGTLHRGLFPNLNHVTRDLHPRSQKRCPNRLTKTSGKSKATSSPSQSTSIIDVTSSKCGPSGATEEVTATTGPNGKLDWLNCGINDAGGWTPPHIAISDIKTKSLSSAVLQTDSPFKACKAYVDMFEQYANEYGFPAILLASFAMQESSCNPNTVGGNGEQGLMQLTKDKCGAAPGGNCKDPNYNIKTGAAFFASLLASNSGDLLLSIGHYNGWFPSMTYGDATAAANGPYCTRQNNLDYLFQFLNGWCQNIDAYDSHLGKYFNLNKCYL